MALLSHISLRFALPCTWFVQNFAKVAFNLGKSLNARLQMLENSSYRLGCKRSPTASSKPSHGWDPRSVKKVYRLRKQVRGNAVGLWKHGPKCCQHCLQIVQRMWLEMQSGHKLDRCTDRYMERFTSPSTCVCCTSTSKQVALSGSDHGCLTDA